MQRTGMPPSPATRCSLWPIQKAACPFAFLLLPTSHALGEPCTISQCSMCCCRSSGHGSFGGCSPVPPLARLQDPRRFRSRILPRLDRGRIPRDVIAQGPANHRFVQSFGQRTLREFRKRGGKGCFARIGANRSTAAGDCCRLPALPASLAPSAGQTPHSQETLVPAQRGPWRNAREPGPSGETSPPAQTRIPG